MGWYLAEGCTTKDSIHIGNTKPNYILELKNIADKCLNKTTYIYTKEYPYDKRLTYHELRIHSQSLSNVFTEIFNKYAKYKKIPTVIQNSPKKVQERFLKGYLLGDGHFLKRDKIWNCSTASEELAMNFMLFGQRLGYCPRLHIQHRKGIPYYCLRFCEYNERIPTRLIPRQTYTHEGYLKNLQEIKQTIENLPSDWSIKIIKEIKVYDYDDMVYDLEVKDNPTFVAGTKILVHNSRKESVLNPKVFIQEVKTGVEDFKQILKQIMYRVISYNKANHQKYLNDNTEFYITSDPVHIFQSDAFKQEMRLMWKSGKLSNKNYCEIVGEVEYRNEMYQIEVENKRGDNKKTLPHMTENKERYSPNFPSDLKKPPKTEDKNGKQLPNDKIDPQERKDKYTQSSKEELVKCPNCEKIFDFLSIKESGMGWVKCPECSEPVTQKDLVESKLRLEGAPYPTNKSLPQNVKNPLDKIAEEIWRKVFNETLSETKNEEQARRAAWTAIKNAGYKKDEKTGKWIKKEEAISKIPLFEPLFKDRKYIKRIHKCQHEEGLPCEIEKL